MQGQTNLSEEINESRSLVQRSVTRDFDTERRLQNQEQYVREPTDLEAENQKKLQREQEALMNGLTGVYDRPSGGSLYQPKPSAAAAQPGN